MLSASFVREAQRPTQTHSRGHTWRSGRKRENYTFYGYDFIGFLHRTYFFMAEYALGNIHIGSDAICVIGQRSFLQHCCCCWWCRRRRHFFIILSIFHYKICRQKSLLFHSHLTKHERETASLANHLNG